MNINLQKINKNIPSFGRLPINFKVVEGVVRDYANRGYQSSTYFSDVRYGVKNPFINDYHKGLAMVKNAELHTAIMRYRRFFSSAFKCQGKDDYMNILIRIIDKVRKLNCGESAELIHFALTKLGIPCRIVSDKTMDHVFVVVNRSTPFTSYKDAKKGEFVADLWLKKTYKSVNDAFVDFKRMFDVTMKNELEDITDKPFKYSLMRPLTQEEKLSNETVLSKLFDALNLLSREARFEAKELKYSTNHVENRNKNQLKHTFEENFEEVLNRFEFRR